jgi:hypothetical protein
MNDRERAELMAAPHHLGERRVGDGAGASGVGVIAHLGAWQLASLCGGT